MDIFNFPCPSFARLGHD